MPRDPRFAITSPARVMMSYMRSLRPKGRLLPARTTTVVVCAAICLSTLGSAAHAEEAPAPVPAPVVPVPVPAPAPSGHAHGTRQLVHEFVPDVGEEAAQPSPSFDGGESKS